MGYARSSEEVVDSDGIQRTVFRFDADGSLTAKAQLQFAAVAP
jgi:hypothetical protein